MTMRAIATAVLLWAHAAVVVVVVVADEVVVPNMAAVGGDPVKAAICMADFRGFDANCIPTALCKELKITQGWQVCMDDVWPAIRAGTCLVYAVGAADEIGFDIDMGALGCEVHTFDPTVTLAEKLAPNVTFHKWGFYGGDRNASAAMHFENRKYGRIEGEMYHLDEVIEKLGHRGRTITVFKIDCEGCEWEVFGYMHSGQKAEPLGAPHLPSSHAHHRSPMDQIQQLLLEVHFSLDFLHTQEALDNVGRSFETIFSSHYHHLPFVRYYVNNNPGGVGRHGWYFDNLTAGGFPTGSCCREMGLVRRPIGHTFTVKELLDVRGITEGTLIRPHDARDVFLFKDGQKHRFPSGAVFMAHGYSFENVKTVPAGEVAMIPEGTGMT